MAALHVAREAITAANWSADDLRETAVVLGTSRGNAAGWLGPWPQRRPFKLMAASNTIHSEPAAAITIEFGIHGPYHVLASGCSAGLDAIGIAAMLVQSGVAPRALAVAVDLPLVPCLLDSYASSGLLSKTASCDPYHPDSCGFIPAEGAAAMTLESYKPGHPSLLSYSANSDASDPLGMPKDGGMSITLMKHAIARHGWPAAICPHATGTAVHAIAEPAALQQVFHGGPLPSLHLLKPFTGHTIGASGLIESAILTAFLQRGQLPPNRPALSSPGGFSLPHARLDASGPVFKLSHSMGGHNALLILSPP
jgi:3-oxoacyl-[acyl-carrier-protein] synthase II